MGYIGDVVLILEPELVESAGRQHQWRNHLQPSAGLTGGKGAWIALAKNILDKPSCRLPGQTERQLAGWNIGDDRNLLR